MKKYVILLVAWALICPLSFAGSKDKGENMVVKIEKENTPGKLLVRLINLEKQNTQIAVQSVDGTTWFSKNIRRKAGFAVKLDLRNIPDGDYVVYVENANKMWTGVFSITTGDIVFFENPAMGDEHGQHITSSSQVCVLPSFNGEQGYGRLITHFNYNYPADLNLVVQLANLQRRPATIQITGVGYEQIYSNTITTENGFAKTFNLNGVTEGNYFVHIKSVDATVVQFFTVADKHLSCGDIHRLKRPEEIVAPEQEVKVQ